MERTDEQIDMFLDSLDIKLLAYQRVMLRHWLKADGNVIITFPPRLGHIEAMKHAHICNELFNNKLTPQGVDQLCVTAKY